jgi:hypothetical protein
MTQTAADQARQRRQQAGEELVRLGLSTAEEVAAAEAAADKRRLEKRLQSWGVDTGKSRAAASEDRSTAAIIDKAYLKPVAHLVSWPAHLAAVRPLRGTSARRCDCPARAC